MTRPINGGMQTTLSVSEFAFPDKFSESIRADAKVGVCLWDCVSLLTYFVPLGDDLLIID